MFRKIVITYIFLWSSLLYGESFYGINMNTKVNKSNWDNSLCRKNRKDFFNRICVKTNKKNIIKTIVLQKDYNKYENPYSFFDSQQANKLLLGIKFQCKRKLNDPTLVAMTGVKYQGDECTYSTKNEKFLLEIISNSFYNIARVTKTYFK